MQRRGGIGKRVPNLRANIGKPCGCSSRLTKNDALTTPGSPQFARQVSLGWAGRRAWSLPRVPHKMNSTQRTQLTFQISALSACVVVAISKSCRARPMSPRYSSMRAQATITGREYGSRESAKLVDWARRGQRGRGQGTERRPKIRENPQRAFFVKDMRRKKKGAYLA